MMAFKMTCFRKERERSGCVARTMKWFREQETYLKLLHSVLGSTSLDRFGDLLSERVPVVERSTAKEGEEGKELVDAVLRRSKRKDQHHEKDRSGWSKAWLRTWIGVLRGREREGMRFSSTFPRSLVRRVFEISTHPVRHHLYFPKSSMQALAAFVDRFLMF